MVKGSGGIQFMRWKTKTEDSLPISEELASDSRTTALYSK